jgi:hypothetical protein
MLGTFFQLCLEMSVMDFSWLFWSLCASFLWESSKSYLWVYVYVASGFFSMPTSKRVYKPTPCFHQWERHIYMHI